MNALEFVTASRGATARFGAIPLHGTLNYAALSANLDYDPVLLDEVRVKLESLYVAAGYRRETPEGFSAHLGTFSYFDGAMGAIHEDYKTWFAVSSLGPVVELHAMLHEYAHVAYFNRLNYPDLNSSPLVFSGSVARKAVEVGAETVAYMVGSALDLMDVRFSQVYIDFWGCASFQQQRVCYEAAVVAHQTKRRLGLL